MLFLSNGKSIVSAKTGVEAIERANSNSPDLCLVSFDLPDLTGDIVAYRIKKLDVTKKTKVIVYNAHGKTPLTRGVRELCKEQGVKYVEFSYFEQLLKDIK